MAHRRSPRRAVQDVEKPLHAAKLRVVASREFKTRAGLVSLFPIVPLVRVPGLVPIVPLVPLVPLNRGTN